jgi:hypothetical protein
MKNIDINILNEVIRDFLKSGQDISIESFKDWFGITLDDKTYGYVGDRIYNLS